MLQYIFEVAMHLVVNRDYRHHLLSLLVRLYAETAVPDYVNVSRCLGPSLLYSAPPDHNQSS